MRDKKHNSALTELPIVEFENAGFQLGDSCDVAFCNFRVMSGGNLKVDYFYRGASPVNNKFNRAALTDKLISENKIEFELNLADSMDYDK